ncbi:hypothetical protein [Labilibaculum sp.]|uniref:hypothetical protein n=1 Tax=Labilibaculum sp. TaxID=2060723 RepID=UPI002AA75F9C|nr:hypothetical protein [Labilibaculum sp.]MBN2596095.1 hypothetical protein [Marinifilaceae bacterium]
MKPTEVQKIIAKIDKNVNSKKWKCIINGCNENAINSHLLQQNGVLDNVSENGHLVEVKPTDIFKWSPNEIPIEMKKIGIKKAFSLPLFCNHHDTELFKEVETHPIDLSDYRIQLLLSYRVVCSEIRKKEVVLDKHNRILNAQTLRGNIDLEIIENLVKGSELGIQDLSFYRKLVDQELQENNNDFKFKIYKYPLIKVYGSAIFSPTHQIVNPERDDPFESVFIHIIPDQNYLNVIIGYHKQHSTSWIEEYVESWKGLDMEPLEEKLTDLFAVHIENWGMSPLIKEKIDSKTIDSFYEFSESNFFLNNSRTVNLFEDNNYGT